MRSKQLVLDHYDTDKIANRYLNQYDPILEPWINKRVKLLEIGVYKGGSLLLWRDYFPLGTIVGIDFRMPRDLALGERIHLFKGRQQDTQFLTKVATEIAPDGFDIIIDDASHIGELTKKTFWHLFDNHLKPFGLYVIEDWGTGYWNDWPDGKIFKLKKRMFSSVWSVVLSKLTFARKIPIKIPRHNHSYGMVGFVKELVDEQGAADLTRASLKGNPKRQSKFEKMIITPSIVFIKKHKNNIKIAV